MIRYLLDLYKIGLYQQTRDVYHKQKKERDIEKEQLLKWCLGCSYRMYECECNRLNDEIKEKDENQ